jgi:hypothetical protein
MEMACSTSSGRYPDPVAASKLQFKFRESVSGFDRRELIDKLFDNGASEVSPLFPDSQDDELSGLYTVQAARFSVVPKLLKLLNGSGEVEFAEPAAERRLILPR